MIIINGYPSFLGNHCGAPIRNNRLKTEINVTVRV